MKQHEIPRAGWLIGLRDVNASALASYSMSYHIFDSVSMLASLPASTYCGGCSLSLFGHSPVMPVLMTAKPSQWIAASRLVSLFPSSCSIRFGCTETLLMDQ